MTVGREADRRRCGESLLRLHTDKPAQHGSLYRGCRRSQGQGLPVQGKAAAGIYAPLQRFEACLYEAGADASGAIAREKQIKAGSRRKKIELINRLNPNG